jgi:mobilome CxxCx(11)CxxC protein
MDDTERRKKSWEKAVDQHGTSEIFALRARSLSLCTRLRDFLGILVPALIGAVATAEWIGMYQGIALAALSIGGVFQFGITAWSLVSRWDEELAYSTRAVRDCTEMRDAWKKIAEGDSDDIAFDWAVALEQQKLIDSHNVLKNISPGEQEFGMRAALFHFHRACVCGKIPPTRIAPRHPAKACECGVCGGNSDC